ncbi:MAG: sigma-E processing peptidase SpoIIGA [Ruminococcus sp.]
MTVYVDTLVFTNIIIDYILLSITGKILKINYKQFRLIIASLLGGISSMIILLPSMNFLFNFVTRLFVTIIIVLSGFGYKNFRTLAKRTFVLFLISTSFSGLILFMLSVVKSDFISVNNSVVYFNISPLMLIVMTTVAYILLRLIDKIRFEKGNLIHKIKIKYDDKEYTFFSKYDTCCNVKEPFSRSEVILAEEKLLKNIIVPDGKYRIIPFNSLGGEGIIKGFLPQELYIDDTKISREVYIGITKDILKGEVNSIFNYKNICE